MIKRITQIKLRFLSKLIIRKYKPKIVAITGSHGKTSTKEACYHVLKNSFQVRRAQGNFNNEFGVPFVIIGVDSPGKNPLAWVKVFFKGAGLILFKQKYPEIIVLEMGADRPGDIAYLMSIVKPDVGVLTGIGRSHIEFFGSVKKICEEKQVLLENIKPNGTAVLNMDDVELCDNMTANLEDKKVIKAGFSERAVDLSGIGFRYLDLGEGVEFELKYKDSSFPVKMPLVFGSRQALGGILAAGVGLAMGMEIREITKALEAYRPPKSRMNLLQGVKKSWVIDDTYNASPHSTVAALEGLKALGGGRRKIFVLGDMLELGEETENCHRGLARKFVDWLDVLITVGDRANFTSDEAMKLGMTKDKIKEYDHVEQLMKDIERIMQPEDVVLVKGSQGARMEKVVKDIMLEPLRAEELIVRQSEWWLKR